MKDSGMIFYVTRTNEADERIPLLPGESRFECAKERHIMASGTGAPMRDKGKLREVSTSKWNPKLAVFANPLHLTCDVLEGHLNPI